MECQYCKKTLSSKSSLNFHQKNTKSCLILQGENVNKKVKCDHCDKLLSCKTSLKRHITKCRHKYKFMEDELQDAKKEIEMLKNTIQELRVDKKDLQERYDNLSLTAVKRPTTSTKNIQINNYIQNMMPLLLEDIKQSVPMLTLEHHVKGPEGYAEFALEFTFKDKIICLDENRDKFKYKNEDGDVIEDIGFRKMMTKLCLALKDRSFNLCQDHYENLSEKFTEEEMKEYNCMETAMAITRYANGRENDFCNKVIKLISKGSKMVK
jgi:hypothetical protein